jgi:hypothetical protein
MHFNGCQLNRIVSVYLILDSSLAYGFVGSIELFSHWPK